MIKKITQKEFIKEIANWTGENVSFNSFLLETLNINSSDNIETILDYIETMFNEYNIYNSVKTWMVKEDLKVEIKSNYLLLNNSRLDLRGKCFKFNDDILGIMDDFLIIYYKNK